ncbi:uncharacterized protein [Triticum aestivum]|uniref:uncharacterized protein n=1 Tax=Triticum aestivum TaxID=4565 RepID=UPI001D034AAE|nr:uncharacterized protein LOC123127483 [Triticum aestivum]
MGSSPRSVSSSVRLEDERPVVSGLGLSEGSGDSEARDLQAVDSELRPAAAAGAGWVRPPPTKKEMWRMRHGLDAQAGASGARDGRASPPHQDVLRGGRTSPPRQEVIPEMKDKCFRCLEKGHFRRDCTNLEVCIRCGLQGHGSRDCKRPRSPSSADELRREAIAKVARRSSPRVSPDLPPPRAPILSPPPPPPPTLRQADVGRAWPQLAPPRLQVTFDMEDGAAGLCVVRRSQSMEDLERRLRFAMVAYVGGARRRLSPQRVHEILEGKLDISADQASVHPYRPEDFLVVFASAEIRNRVAACPSVEFQGDRLLFRPWNRQSQAVHSVMGFKVWLVLEGIPPHAWDRATAEELLGSSCKVDVVASESTSRADLSSFKLSAWTADPDEIPTMRWLAVPEPGTEAPPPLLQYKVLIHVDAVADFRDAGEPLFLGGSSDSGQSGIPDSDEDFGGESRPRKLVWTFGVRDSRGGGQGSGAAGVGHGGSVRSRVASDWRLPPMDPVSVVSRSGPGRQVCERLTTRQSAFDRLNGQHGHCAADKGLVQTNLNGQGAAQSGQVTVVKRALMASTIVASAPHQAAGPERVREVRPGMTGSPIASRADTTVVPARDGLANNVSGALVPSSVLDGPQVVGSAAQRIAPDPEAGGVVGVEKSASAGTGGSNGEQEMEPQAATAPEPEEGALDACALLIAGGPPDGDHAVEPCMETAEISMVVPAPEEEAGYLPPTLGATAHSCMQMNPTHVRATQVLGSLETPDVGGDRQIVQGSLEVPDVGGDMQTMQGSLGVPDVEGDMQTVQGSLETPDVVGGGMQTVQGLDVVGMRPQEVVAFDKLKWFCSSLVKKLAPPLLKEVQASGLRPEAEPFTPRRTTRATKRAPQSKQGKATPAENVLMHALGLMPQDLEVDEAIVDELQQLFDSPLRTQHVRVIAALFGKELPTGSELHSEAGLSVVAH